MTRPPDAERGGSRSLFGARAGGQPPPDDDELFTDEELSWEDDGAPPDRDEAAPGWPIPRRRPDGAEESPFRRRRIVAAAAIGLLAVVGIVLGVTLGSGSSPKPSAPTVPSITVETTGTTAATTPTPKVSLPGGKALKDGSTGAAVKALQRALDQLGFDVGKADGTFGPKTKAAVISFQQQHNLTQDGVVGSKTVAALNAALSG